MNMQIPLTGTTEHSLSTRIALPPRVLVIAGDEAGADSIARHLDENGFHVRARPSLREGLRDLADRTPDLVILNRHLGRTEGLDMLRAIRSRSDVPVIIITDIPDDELDRVLSLELGADDCMTNPVGPRELVARIRAVLRRLAAGPEPGADREQGRYRFGGWILDRRQRRLTNPAGSPVALSKGEYGLLVAFLKAPQRPLSREHLLRATRIHEDVFDRSVDVQVLRLRRKVEADPSAPRLIKTERGIGYVFAAPVDRLA